MSSISEIAATIEAFPNVLAHLLEPVDHDVLRRRPAPEEWCPLEVIGHVIACDSETFRDRIAQVLRGESLITMDPWAAINERDFASESLGDLLEELRNERAQSAAFLRTLSTEELTATSSFVGGRREYAAGDFVFEWPFHDQDHLQQILECTKSAYLPSMTDAMRKGLAEMQEANG